MQKIFISYRRTDSAYPAQSIYEALIKHFGNESVIFDVESINYGSDFVQYLNDSVAQCDILLALIGDHWLSELGGDGKPRLENPNDFVRIEIETALKRDIPVIPVLVGRAAVPKIEQLPIVLQDLAARQAAEVRPGRDFHAHLERLIKGVEQVLAAPRLPRNQSNNLISIQFQARIDSIPEEFRAFRESLNKAIAISVIDKDMSLVRIRKILDFIAGDLFEKFVGEQAGTRPLENLLQRLVKDSIIPRRILVHADGVRSFGNVGAHYLGETTSIDDVKICLEQILIVIEWYINKLKS